PDNRCFLTACHQASALADFCDATSSSMAWEGARRLRAVKHPSPADNDGIQSSSTASARLFLLCVVKHCREAYVTTRGRRACFFVAYDDTVYYIHCSNVHYKEP